MRFGVRIKASINIIVSFSTLFLIINVFLGITNAAAVFGFYAFASVVLIKGVKKLFQTEFPLYIIF